MFLVQINLIIVQIAFSFAPKNDKFATTSREKKTEVFLDLKICPIKEGTASALALQYLNKLFKHQAGPD